MPALFPEYFAYNRELWAHIVHNRHSRAEIEDLIYGALGVIERGLEDSAKDRLVLADAVSFFVQLIFASESRGMLSMILTEASDWDFDYVLRMLETVISRDFQWAYLPMAVKQIAQSETTSVLPWDTHMLVHRNSVLLNRISLNNAHVSVVDIENNYLMLPTATIRDIFQAALI